MDTDSPRRFLFDFAHAWPLLDIEADFKHVPEDFVVVESLPFELDGEGEHAWLYVEKTGSNTEWVARQLARHAGIPDRRVSYAGQKDRQAVCRQWFSVHLPGREDPDWSVIASDEFVVLQQQRHSRKLQRGALKQNSFTIRLRGALQVAGEDGLQQLEQRLELIRDQGVPNYFGEQRFGHDMDNLVRAEAMFASNKRRTPIHKRSMYLSAARSWLFNRILSARVEANNWNRALPGDVFMLEGSQACFADDGSPDLEQRLAAGDIHPTAAMWGKGESMATQDVLELEQAIVAGEDAMAGGLVKAGLKQQRRACRLLPRDLEWQAEAADLVLQLTLPAGAYATTVLRELCRLRVNQVA